MLKIYLPRVVKNSMSFSFDFNLFLSAHMPTVDLLEGILILLFDIIFNFKFLFK